MDQKSHANKKEQIWFELKKIYNILEKPAHVGFENQLEQVLAIRAQNRVFPLETHLILWEIYKLYVD